MARNAIVGVIKMAKYGKAFRKKSNRGKYRKGTLIKYKYVRGRKVGAVKVRSNNRRRRSYRRRY